MTRLCWFGDSTSFGRLSNKYIADVMGTSNENEAVYEASLETAKTMMQAFDMTGFTKVLPCLGDHELGKQTIKNSNPEIGLQC